MVLEVNNLNYRYNDKFSITDISLIIDKYRFIGVIGPNGSGKSTLLKNIYRLLKPQSGSVKIDDKDVDEMSYKESAKIMAIVGQENDNDIDYTVKEMVLMGRTPHKKLLELNNQNDYQLVKEALAKVGLLEMIDYRFNDLSGGEKQRVRLARALVQQPKILILDEPTNHLDIYYQLLLFDILKKEKMIVISVIHDLNIACMFCDYIYVMNNGYLYKEGIIEDVFNEELVKDVFKVNCIIEKGKQLRINYLPLKGDKDE